MNAVEDRYSPPGTQTDRMKSQNKTGTDSWYGIIAPYSYDECMDALDIHMRRPKAGYMRPTLPDIIQIIETKTASRLRPEIERSWKSVKRGLSRISTPAEAFDLLDMDAKIVIGNKEALAAMAREQTMERIEQVYFREFEEEFLLNRRSALLDENELEACHVMAQRRKAIEEKKKQIFALEAKKRQVLEMQPASRPRMAPEQLERIHAKIDEAEMRANTGQPLFQTSGEESDTQKTSGNNFRPHASSADAMTDEELRLSAGMSAEEWENEKRRAERRKAMIVERMRRNSEREKRERMISSTRGGEKGDQA